MINLRLLQLADSALPISGYTHSWGLEAAVSERLVRDPATLEWWTRNWLRSAVAPMEGVLVASACRAVADAGGASGRRAELAEPSCAAALTQLNQLADVSLVIPSIRAASREMGEQLLNLGRTWIWSADALATLAPDLQGPWHHPVTFGVLGGIAGGVPRDVLGVFLHQAALGMIGAGLRAIPVGHTHGQQILAYLHDELEELAERGAEGDCTTAGSGCPWYEVLCDAQTQLYARLFRS